MRLPCGCPDAVPDWNDRDVDLSHHAAHILPVPTLLHMPLSHGLYVQRQRHDIEQLELRETWPGLVLLQTGFFGGRIIALLESAESPSRHVQTLPAPFRVRGKLHAGGIGTVRNSVRALQSQLLDAGRMPKELYLAHLTCPQCSEQRGGDRILVLRRWVDSPRLRGRA
jgi:hypothetical protein